MVYKAHDPSPDRPDPGSRIYLAGPFTSQARPLDGDNAVHVIDQTSAWRSALVAAEVALVRRGWTVFLPHRDVSAWGMRQAPPETVARECIAAVLDSDVVVAVLGESFGTHIEVGVALGRGIPTVIVRSGEFPESYFGGGVAGSAMTGQLPVRSVGELAAYLAGPAFTAAVSAARRASARLVTAED